MAALDQQNRKLRAAKKNILEEPNIGDCIVTPWYTDESFGQQRLTGVNPATIEIASDKWISEFQQEASKQSKKDVGALIADPAKRNSMYVQDYSTFELQPVCPQHRTSQQGSQTVISRGTHVPR